jgi:aminomethyltransferase
MGSEILKKTQLNPLHRQLGGKMVNFAGWDMPVEYSGLRLEHMATRDSVGLFDVSHMGEISVQGSGALGFLQMLLTNDVSKCAIGQAQYNILLNDQGGALDDLIVYRLDSEDYLLVVNASNKDKDWNWILNKSKSFKNINVEDQSQNWSQIAVQGPKAVSLVSDLFPETKEIKKFRFKKIKWKDQDWIFSRTGYTGEDGFEIYGPNEGIEMMWGFVYENGQKYKLLPCGLGARNTLRIEAALPLYGNEMNEQTAPLNIGMDWAIKLSKPDKFFGSIGLTNEFAESAKGKRLVGLISLDKAIPRDGYKVFSLDKTEIGFVSSGTYSPSLEKPIALAFIDKNYVGERCLIEVRKNLVDSQIVTLPFVNKK